MRKTRRILAIQALVVCGLAFGQVIVSSIIGHVTDATGASVPGARITVTNTGTGVAVNTITGSEGTYSFPGLLSGTYELTVANRANRRGARRYGRQPVSCGGGSGVDDSHRLHDHRQFRDDEAAGGTAYRGTNRRRIYRPRARRSGVR